LLKKVSSCQ